MKGGLKMVRYDLISQDPAIDRKFVGKWYTLVGLKQIRELKLRIKDKFPQGTDSDLTFEEFLNPQDFFLVGIMGNYPLYDISLKLQSRLSSIVQPKKFA